MTQGTIMTLFSHYYNDTIFTLALLYINKPISYYVRLFFPRYIIHIMSLLVLFHIMSLLFHLFFSEFLVYMSYYVWGGAGRRRSGVARKPGAGASPFPAWSLGLNSIYSVTSWCRVFSADRNFALANLKACSSRYAWFCQSSRKAGRGRPTRQRARTHNTRQGKRA
jgi:hypothetical protein